ncbi:hypothetical protein KEM55_005703 [Ascosphaera atra]|nr:hypothetical protein KEM55_005703 [Ascosphaera atra]
MPVPTNESSVAAAEGPKPGIEGQCTTSSNQGQMSRDEKTICTLQAKLEKTASELEAVETSIAEVQKQLSSISEEAAKDPSAVVNRHIRLLHEYNEVKDTAQGLLNMIAEARGMRYVDVQREYGVSEND